MATFSLSDNELEVLQKVIKRFTKISSELDSDTLSAVRKVEAGTTELELSQLERIGLQSILQVSAGTLEMSEEETDIDLEAVHALIDKLS